MAINMPIPTSEPIIETICSVGLAGLYPEMKKVYTIKIGSRIKLINNNLTAIALSRNKVMPAARLSRLLEKINR